MTWMLVVLFLSGDPKDTLTFNNIKNAQSCEALKEIVITGPRAKEIKSARCIAVVAT